MNSPRPPLKASVSTGLPPVETLAKIKSFAEVIDAYESLREKCYLAACRDNGALMGADQWLRSALSETDIEMTAALDGIRCHGFTYTSQTMSNEPFDFVIPFSALDAKSEA